MPVIPVNGPAPYHVHIGHGLAPDIVDTIRESGAAQVAILCPEVLSASARRLADAVEGAGVRCHVWLLPDAERAKQLSVVSELWDKLGAAGFGRQDLVVGFGGGATTDLAGFVAATWMRGIRVVQVPTTLLAMVDAAVGGKTGINTAAGKNLVGSFHEPLAVFADIEVLRSLPDAEMVAGSAEIIKTGFIHDPEIIELYRRDPAACLDPDGALPELIARSVAVKARVVGEDLKESGLRETLNYGHTFGHAIERAEDYSWRHGNAVAVGMMFVAYLAEARGLIDADVVELHRDVLTSVGLPVAYRDGQWPELHAAMRHDKKNRDGKIRFVALTAVGATTRIEGPSEDELCQAFEKVSS